MLEILLGSVGIVVVAIIGYMGKQIEVNANTKKSFYTDLAARQDQMQKDLDALRNQSIEDRKRIGRLEGELMDAEETLKDAEAVIRWVQEGANPPVPGLTWRLNQWLRRKITSPLEILDPDNQSGDTG